MLQKKERRDRDMNIPNCQADMRCSPIICEKQIKIKINDRKSPKTETTTCVFLSDTYRGVVDIAR